jgi:hypothetical protein
MVRHRAEDPLIQLGHDRRHLEPIWLRNINTRCLVGFQQHQFGLIRRFTYSPQRHLSIDGDFYQPLPEIRLAPGFPALIFPTDRGHGFPDRSVDSLDHQPPNGMHLTFPLLPGSAKTRL